MIKRGAIRCSWQYVSQQNDIHHNDTWRNDTQHNDTWRNDTWRNDTWRNETQHNDTWHNDTWRNDTQHNDTWCNDTQHNGLNYDMEQSIFFSSAECRYAERQGARERKN